MHAPWRRRDRSAPSDASSSTRAVPVLVCQRVARATRDDPLRWQRSDGVVDLVSRRALNDAGMRAGAPSLVQVHEGVYSATQSTCIDCGVDGQAKPEEHQVCWVRSRVIAWFGTSDAVFTEPHSSPSTV